MSASRIHFHPKIKLASAEPKKTISKPLQQTEKIQTLLQIAPELADRFLAVTSFGKKIRSSEYHLTNACNIRCDGCWFFEHEHEIETREQTNLDEIRKFVQKEKIERGINSALVIGGEPTLFPERLAVFSSEIDYLTISTNGLKKLEINGFENTTIGITIFGGGLQDDKLRGIKPNGEKFSGLFDQALKNYKNDERAGFVYALTLDGVENIEKTVEKIHKNGNLISFNYYYRSGNSNLGSDEKVIQLCEEAKRVKNIYTDTIVSHPYFIDAIISGKSHWDDFGYANCPSVSIDHPENIERLSNGNPFLPRFNTWAADLKTLKFCCTSGHCEGCRDSQAIYSWLIVNINSFLKDSEQLKLWIELAESYWSQFIWSPYHRKNKSKI